MANFPDKIRLNFDSTQYKSKDDAKRGIAQIRQRLRPVDIAPAQLVDCILQGCTFCPAELTGTTADTWASQQLFCLDIDNDNNDICTPDDAAMILFERDIMPLCIYYSFSHTTDHPKFRVLILADTPVKDADQAQRIRAGLITLFGGRADGACKDAARLFFGTDKGVAMAYHAWTTPVSVLDGIAAPVSVPEPISEPAPAQTMVPTLTSSASTPHTTGDDISLVNAINDFDLAAYIERTTHTQPRIRGHQKLFNPCPICGHNDDFYVDGSRFICFGAHGLQGGGGNVITYLEHVQRLDRRGAREYFLRDILGVPARKMDKGKDKSNSGSGKTLLTEKFLRTYLSDIGVTARYNMLSKRIEIDGDLRGIARGDALNLLPILIGDELRQRNIKGARTQNVRELITLIAGRDRYNPIQQYLDGITWDKRDRLKTVYAALGIADNPLYRTYVGKWLLQCVALGLNDENTPLGAEGVLVLAGAQGAGKTAFFRQITPRGLFVEGASIDTSSTSGGKDSILRATSGWITELGELDSTTKKEQPALKAFLTSPIDQVRQPYAATDTREIRRTSFCGTVNGSDFLVDTTGSRRFWVVPVQKIDKNIVFSVFTDDFIAQLWGQMYELYIKRGVRSFRLTDAEMEEVQTENRAFEQMLPWEIDIRDRLDFTLPPDGWQWVTAATLKTLGYIPQTVDTCKLGRVLQKIIGDISKDGLMPSDISQLERRVKGTKQYLLPLV